MKMVEDTKGAVDFEQGFTITGWSAEQVLVYSCYNMINIFAWDLEAEDY